MDQFSFLLVLVMVMYDNEFVTKERKIEPRMKLNHNIITCMFFYFFNRNIKGFMLQTGDPAGMLCWEVTKY